MSNLYRFVRYPGKPFPQTHPDRLASMGLLYGMEPAAIEQARVLEIGCCDGGNLIPMAIALPGSEFVGIDLTEPDIEDAREAAAALGIRNAHFHVMDLVDLPGQLGQFDYVICHGLYSWVPLPVRDKMLAVIQASLTVNGIAYVSYNSMPGGYFRIMVREMMLFHLRGVTDRDERLMKAREFLKFMQLALKQTSQERVLLRQVELSLAQSDHSLFHDELAEHYHPVFFREFVEHAERCGLQYLSEASYFVTRPETLGSDYADAFVKAAAGFGSDLAPQVEYLDLLHCSYFHQSLVCRKEVELKRPVTPERMRKFSFASPSTAEALAEGEAFVAPHGLRIVTNAPFVLALLHALIDVYPNSVQYRNLPGAETAEAELCGTLLALMNMGIVVAHIYEPEFSLTAGEYPVAGALARRQAVLGRRMTDLRHCPAEIDDRLQIALVPLLDGTRNRTMLLAALPQDVFPVDPGPGEALEKALDGLARCCMLVS